MAVAMADGSALDFYHYVGMRVARAGGCAVRNNP